MSGSAGSFATDSVDALTDTGWERWSTSLALSTAATDRFLDPPVEENFTNHGTTSNGSFHLDHDLPNSDRIAMIVRYGQSNFLVPNEHVQQAAGQRQDRDAAETGVQFSYQKILSPRVLADVRGMARDVSAGLWSNPSSTPVIAEQDRGFREMYVKGTMTASTGCPRIEGGR